MPSHTAREFDKDLEAAGIEKYTVNGKLDFHACRVAYINLVLDSGVTVKEAQVLARHATPEMTMNVYGWVREYRLAEVVEKVGGNVKFQRERVKYVSKLAVGAEQKTQPPLTKKELRSLQMVEAAGIEPVGVVSQHDAEPIQKPAKSQQNNALGQEAQKPSEQKYAETKQNQSTFLRPKCVPSVHGNSLPKDLAKVVEVWDRLPPPIKAAIVAIVEAAGKE